MIEIIGEEGTSEYGAAFSLAGSLEKLWPGLETSPANKEHVRISANVKISGYQVSDIDVVVCGVFTTERKFIPNKLLHDKNGALVFKNPISLQNFVVVVEVKDHSEHSVQVTGDKISVKYSRGGNAGWKSATDQNINQLHSLHSYLKDRGNDVYVYRCVLMRGLASVKIGGAIAAGFSGVDFLTAIARISNVSKSVRGFTLSSGSNSDLQNVLKAPIFRPITPSALDRKRMDMIVADTPEGRQLLSCLGKKMVHLRGHGGTGKTVMLLQMAWRAFDERGLRTLVLTYNHALAADIRRLLALLNIPSSPEEGGVVIVTVMSFMHSWFHELEITTEDDDLFYKDYNKYCSSALDLIEAGAINSDDIDTIIAKRPDRFDFDCVVVDESQDWPQAEADLLKALYPPTKICLADGIEQLIRGSRTGWLRGIDESVKETINLKRCLRMKRNLAVFANQIAEAAQIKWKVLPNEKAGGGRIIILLKPYLELPALHESLVDEAKEKGNAEIDFLFCVPPSSVSQNAPQKESDIGSFLSKSGHQVWDGVDSFLRQDFPRSKNQFRIVQFASCRGLEGWTVVLHNADQYWEECRRGRLSIGLTEEERMAFGNIEDISEKYAWNRLMIAMTRPIDTLVISVSTTNSTFTSALLNFAKEYSEFVEIVK
jgi:hypothetical protein